jgi:hypothetical protein
MFLVIDAENLGIAQYGGAQTPSTHFGGLSFQGAYSSSPPGVGHCTDGATRHFLDDGQLISRHERAARWVS